MVNNEVDEIHQDVLICVEHSLELLISYANKGWFSNHLLEAVRLNGWDKNLDDDTNFINLLSDNWDDLWFEALIFCEPKRKDQLLEVKTCFDKKLYFPATLSLAVLCDSIYWDKYSSANAYKKEGLIVFERFSAQFTLSLEKSCSLNFIKDLKGGNLVFKQYLHEVYSALSKTLCKHDINSNNQQGVNVPNRHAIIHGYYSDEFDETKAFKWLSIFLFFTFAMNIDKWLTEV